jgi:hypothetical protein
MPTLVVDRRGIPLLGREERAEELVEWSKKQRPSTRWIKDLACGLRLGFVSSGEEPKMYIHWNQQRFWRFMDGLGGLPERFFVTAYGICVEHYLGRTIVKLLGAGRTGQVLWDSLLNGFSRQQSLRGETEVNWLVGMVRFSQEGPLFHTQVESQHEVEEAAALAVVTKKKKTTVSKKAKTVGDVLPKAPPLSPKARSFLLHDALTNIVLRAIGEATAG